MTQDEALDILKTGQNVFLTGAAGTGKTFTLNSYITYLKEHKIPVAITASTGIAATHMDGRTVHSWSGIAIRKELTEKELKELYYNTFTNERINGARVLIIDEISMLEARVFSLVDKVCRFVRQDPHPFGGLQVIVCGDFFQLPPVPNRYEPPPKFAFQSPSWARADFKVCYLTKQYRQEDARFLQLLNSIRHNETTEETPRVLETRLEKSVEGFPKPPKLYSHRNDVDAINNYELGRLQTDPHTYQMQSWGEAELVASLKDSCLAPQELVLKIGAQVMFVRNSFSEHYVNGTLGIIVGFEEDTEYPIVQLRDERRIIARSSRWSIEEDGELLAYIEQIPLRLAWAITIHKSQGMTLDAAEINLSKAFAHGMGYVALSRVRTLESIKLLGLNEMALKVSPAITQIDARLKALSVKAQEDMNIDTKLLHQLQEDFLIR